MPLFAEIKGVGILRIGQEIDLVEIDTGHGKRLLAVLLEALHQRAAVDVHLNAAILDKVANHLRRRLQRVEALDGLAVGKPFHKDIGLWFELSGIPERIAHQSSFGSDLPRPRLVRERLYWGANYTGQKRLRRRKSG